MNIKKEIERLNQRHMKACAPLIRRLVRRSDAELQKIFHAAEEFKCDAIEQFMANTIAGLCYGILKERGITVESRRETVPQQGGSKFRANMPYPANGRVQLSKHTTQMSSRKRFHGEYLPPTVVLGVQTRCFAGSD